MTSFSLLSQLIQRVLMPDSVPSHCLLSFRQSFATAMAYQKGPWHQKTDRFGVEGQMKRHRSAKWGQISSGHKPALQAVAAWIPGHSRQTALAFFPTVGVCSPIWPKPLGTVGNRVVGFDRLKRPTSSARHTRPRDAGSHGRHWARSDRRGFSAY